MTDMKKPVPAWVEESLEDRLHRCVAMLYLHGLIPEGQRTIIVNKISKLGTKAKRPKDGYVNL